jgi:hypothetical protein
LGCTVEPAELLEAEVAVALVPFDAGRVDLDDRHQVVEQRVALDRLGDELRTDLEQFPVLGVRKSRHGGESLFSVKDKRRTENRIRWGF